VGLLIWQTGIFDLGILAVVIAIILIIGSINAYNFMDGSMALRSCIQWLWLARCTICCQR
jgi:UDP-N-acetylmuramyl pentapeptide phosphotransferase/UDP-N-acetylglucosamine-1-phosphate transferase